MIEGSSYKKDLLKVIDVDQLPTFLGGNNPTKIQDGCFKELFDKAIQYKTWNVREYEARMNNPLNSSAHHGSLNHSGMMMQKPIQNYSSLSGVNRSMNESIIDDEDVFEEFLSTDRIRQVFVSTPLHSPYHSNRDMAGYSFQK